MHKNESKHLSRLEKIKLGSYYTPKELVNIVYNFINPYLKNNKKNIVIFDSAAGCGAFINKNIKYNYRVADCDKFACDFLKNDLNLNNIFCSNSLIDVNRTRYNISPGDFLIMIGNPPYNDTTSEFKNGQKGNNPCDEDLFDRDLGVSFLKSYNKLKADIVCVLHPLSYLIKKTNFNRLKAFKNNYKLIDAIIFSSSLFLNTGSIKFPIMIGLYERNLFGMDYYDIKHFEFSILNQEKKFILSNFNTTDGYINKYPPRSRDNKNSPIDIYYYTFRDFNSLKKNASFINYNHPNGIIVDLENFYKYAYLDTLKNLFKPNDIWLYGNLSPLIDMDILEKYKKDFILYSIETNKVLSNLDKKIINKILEYYKINKNYSINIDKLKLKLSELLLKLI